MMLSGADDRVISDAVLPEGIWVPPLSRCRIDDGAPALVVSFGSITAREAERFASALAAISRSA